jgi:ribonuclease./Phage Mu protein F like protein.
MVSKNYKNWLSVEDERRCEACEENHGKIYEIDEIPTPEPPLHDHCRCAIVIMKAVLAGEATDRGKNGADWWLVKYGHLPPYYITKEEAKNLGWRARKANLAVVAPSRMLAKGLYWNDDGHLPMAEGRQWFEADINYVSGRRNDERIVYSNDGLIFITKDHFQTFIEVTSQV